VTTVVVLFLVGSISARFSDQAWWRTGFTTMCLGALTALVAYGIGYGLSAAVSTADCNT